MLLPLLGALDLLSGAFVILWPGVWQEYLHPYAPGTTFEAIQRMGAVWMARGVIALIAARRPEWRTGAGLMWVAEVPGDLLLAWRFHTTGPDTVALYLAHAALATGVAWRLLRRRSR